MAVPDQWAGVVKIQRELTTGREDRTALIYSRTGRIYTQLPMDSKLLAMFGDDLKIYCYAVLDLDGVLDIKHKVKPREW